jgi:threonine/homoserine/homoserine lactone efflux protein
MAWKIINATIDNGNRIKGQPITFVQSLLFQWINPKGLVTGISAVSAYTDIHSTTPMLLQVAIVAAVAVISTSIGAITWVFGGTIIKKLLKNNIHLKVFNCFMAALLVLSVLLIMLE